MSRFERNPNQETGIHTVHIRGVAASISHQKGSVILFAPSSYNGRRLTIKGLDNSMRGTVSYMSVSERRSGKGKQYAAVSSRLLPGNYYADDGIYHQFAEFTIDANYVTIVEWTY